MSVTANPGAGGATFATDTIGGVDFPLTKINLGAAGIDAGPVTNANPFPVSLQATITVPVTGTFWQATQPVSGPLTDVQLRASAVPVSGTFFQATQPVSAASLPLPTGAATEATLGTRLADATFTGRIPANGQANMAGSVPVVIASNQSTLNVLEAINTGRTNLRYYATAVAAGATTVETAVTLTRSADNGATTTGTSFVITNGKKFRITQIQVASRGHSTATAQVTTFSLRVNTAGAVTTSSTPIEWQARVATPATANAWDRYSATIPEGWEITGDGTLQFGVTINSVFVTNAPTLDVLIMGYEY